ncbi:McrB family protein [Wenyingzhuangia sp. IMCC45533]
MNLDKYEKWLVTRDNKTEGSAKSYKSAIPKIQEHYNQHNGNSIDFFQNSILEFEKLIELYSQKGIYNEFGNKSNGTYRNALNALLRFKNDIEIIIDRTKNYYCVGFHFYSKKASEQNQLKTFIDNNVWVNGYDNKYHNRVNKVKVGSVIAAKTTYTMNEDDKTIPVMGVHCIGIVTGNPKNGKELTVKWKNNFKPYVLKGTGGYRDTISQVHKKDNIKIIFGMGDVDSELVEEDEKNKIKAQPINQILYGPPGTGKTHYLKNEIFHQYTTLESNITKEENFTNIVGQCSWWQVIVVALTELGTCKVNDILNHAWVQKKATLSNATNVRSILWSQLQSHTVLDCKHVNVTDRANPLLFSKTSDSLWSIDTLVAKELVPELLELQESVTNFIPNPDKLIKRYKFVTFHQSYAYEDFIEGIKPVLTENEQNPGQISYCIEDGIFKDLCIKAKNDPKHRYAIFIDEINRGNVSAIFGELITLIEKDKRTGAKNEILIELPYSKTIFGVPANLDVYGTMNTADRSVEALDTALRRRFVFKEIMPDSSKIKTPEFLINTSIKLSNVLDTINKRIEVLIDRDHTIGHSYFMNITTEAQLANTFNNSIVPLLQEYFYGDYGKIGLVLGTGFVKAPENNIVEFSNFNYPDVDQFENNTYILKSVDKNTIINAIKTLLNIEETTKNE